MKKKLDISHLITILIIIAVYAGVFVMEQTMAPTSMIFTVLKKGATYALVAVSMNLLNGFTGIFSLGQAGFLLSVCFLDLHHSGGPAPDRLPVL